MSVDGLDDRLVEMDLDPAKLSKRKNTVRLFYKEVWEKGDLSHVPGIFHEGFTFRGSLGPSVVGHDAFGAYVKWLLSALDNYKCDILDLIEQDDRIAGKLRFSGDHNRQTLFGSAASGRHVWWLGVPIFTFDGDKVRDLWVLGDVHGLLSRQKSVGDATVEFSLPAQA
jgi:predicted ester cyclase